LNALELNKPDRIELPSDSAKWLSPIEEKNIVPERIQLLMANTSKLSREERKKVKREARKKRKTTKPLARRDYARGSKKSKVKKLARGQSKRG